MLKKRVNSSGVLPHLGSIKQQKQLQNYGRSVIVTEQQFKPQIIPNRRVKQKMRESMSVRSSHISKKQYSQEQRDKLQACFRQFSTQKTIKHPPRSKLNAYGIRQVFPSLPQTTVTMSQQELGKLFVSAGMPIHGHTLNQIYTQLIKVKGKGISFQNLIEVLELEPGELDDESDYKKIFEMYDKKRRGYFDFEDYRLVGQGVAKYVTDSELRDAFNGIDLDRNGRVTYANFVKVMMAVR